MTQVILAFWLVLAYDLLEDRQTHMTTALDSSIWILNFEFEPITILC